jgi:2-keto-3-deoxy-L-rhamnonate aldolase RhmA
LVNQQTSAKRVLDAGVHGVIFPFTSTPELAAQAVAACKYPPHGRRGSGAGLARFAWPQVEDYQEAADEQVMVIIIIEEARAVENIDAIASTPGVDAMFIGTSDLSFSLGLRGNQNHPMLDAAVQKVVDAAKRHGKVVGRPAGSPEAVQRGIDQGFLLFQAPTDLGFMTAGAKHYLEPLHKAAGQPKAKAIY